MTSQTRIEPFSTSQLKRIFQFDGNSTRLLSRENSWLEFKEAFNWSNKEAYGKTMAAYANAKGGYIVFGVKNNPRNLVGLANDRFEQMDPAKIAEFLNTTFAPEIEFELGEYSSGSTKVGLIYVYESARKPVICMKNIGSDLKEAEIYYRYRGRSEKAKYPELKSIFEEERLREQMLWMQHIEQIATIGVAQAAIFNPSDGKVTGSGGTFVISEELLPKLKFIKRGNFSEEKGSPTLRLIGDVQPLGSQLMQPVKQMVKYKNLRSPDILMAFLNREKVSEPLEYIRTICFEPTAYLPIYYFMKLADLSIPLVIDDIQKLQNTGKQTTERLLSRLQQDEDFTSGSLESGSAAAVAKKKMLALIKQRNVPNNISGRDIVYLLQAITHLSKSEIEWDYLSSVLKSLFKNQYSSAVADPFRRATCHIDKALYRTAVTVNTKDTLRLNDKKLPPLEQLSEWAIGEIVIHPKFGRGSVLELLGQSNKQQLVAVQFDTAGRRILDPRFAKLSRGSN